MLQTLKMRVLIPLLALLLLLGALPGESTQNWLETVFPSRTTRAQTSHTTPARDTTVTLTPTTTTPAPSQASTTTPLPTAAPTPTPLPQPTTITVTISVDARNVLNNASTKQQAVDVIGALIATGRASSNGHLYGPASLTLPVGASVYDALMATGLSVGSQSTSMGVYISSIQGLGAFDGGPQSGWIYLVNGSVPNVGASSYTLHGGDTILWRYTITGGGDVYY